jgi:hypothetical protein
MLRWVAEHNLHIALGIWILLVIPTLTVWKNSVPWLNFMSIYAIIIGYVSAIQGKKAQKSPGKRVKQPRVVYTVDVPHDFPAKHKDFRPWKNKLGIDYGDWTHVPDELYQCVNCGIEWGESIRQGKSSCVGKSEGGIKPEIASKEIV